MKKSLETTTLVCIDCVNYGEAISALKKSMYQIDFARVIYLTDIRAYNPKFGFEIIRIDKISSKQEYSEFVFKKLASFIDTEHLLIIHADGYVIDGDAWDDEFYKYDYIGSPWLYPEGRNVGNGVSFRSKRLQDILASDDFMNVMHPEDDAICRLYGEYLEKKYDIKFAPEELADKFGYELRQPMCSTFLFHGNFHEPFKPTVCIKRDAALGDCVMIEPLMDYYYKKGYNIVLDIPVDFFLLYFQHHFPVKHINIHDKRVPYKLVDLNGSYERNPKQLHLKSYYEAAGIKDGEIRNPKLDFTIYDGNRLFKKYAVIHIDDRSQPHRNIYGIEWSRITKLLHENFITPIQIGQRQHEEIEGAIFMQTVTVNMMMYLIAGADLFIGVDSAPSNIAVALGTPSIVFHGSVNPEYIYPEPDKVTAITKHKGEGVCQSKYCWHDVVDGTDGKDCYVDVAKPPCTQFDTEEVLQAIKEGL